MKRTEHTQKWLDALRSGKYEQGRGGLRVNNTFCCLGVLCDVSGIGEWMDRGNYHAYLDSAGTLSYTEIRTFGISHREADTLMDMNDYQRKTFPEIADEIEKMLDDNS